jgi:hypothetical protein
MQNMCCASGLGALEDAAVGVFGFIGRGGRPVSCAVVRLPADGMRAVPGSDRVTLTGIDHDGLLSVVPVTGEVQLDADEIPLQAGLPDGPACLLVHEESVGLSDLRQLRFEGELVSGRLSVRRRSGTLAAAHRSPLAQLRDLAALSRAATANRTRIESWKTRLGSDRKATVRSD